MFSIIVSKFPSQIFSKKNPLNTSADLGFEPGTSWSAVALAITRPTKELSSQKDTFWGFQGPILLLQQSQNGLSIVHHWLHNFLFVRSRLPNLSQSTIMSSVIHRITPPAHSGAESSVRLLLTKNPARSYNCPWSKDPPTIYDSINPLRLKHSLELRFLLRRDSCAPSTSKLYGKTQIDSKSVMANLRDSFKVLILPSHCLAETLKHVISLIFFDSLVNMTSFIMKHVHLTGATQYLLA